MSYILTRNRTAQPHRCPVLEVFDDACKRAPAQYWVWDAVHPTYSGHQLMADEWIKTASQF